MSSFGFVSSMLLSLSLLILFSSSSVFGHVSFSPREAPENSYQFFTMNVPHGCGENIGTTKLTAIFPPYITAVTLERQIYFTTKKSSIIDPTDNQLKLKIEWTMAPGSTPLANDEIQRLGFQIKTPLSTNNGLTTTSAGIKQMIMPVYQECEADKTANWTITTIITPATTTTPPPSGTTTAPMTTTASASAHNHDTMTEDSHSSTWTSSDKLSVASLILCSIMFISTLVLVHKSSFNTCMNNNNNNNYNNNNNNNNNNNIKRIPSNTTKDVTLELEEKANANGAV